MCQCVRLLFGQCENRVLFCFFWLVIAMGIEWGDNVGKG